MKRYINIYEERSKDKNEVFHCLEYNMTMTRLTWLYQLRLYGVRNGEGSGKTMECLSELRKGFHPFVMAGATWIGWSKLRASKKFVGLRE